MSQLIESNLELFEVLNAFPFLKEKLSSLNFNLSDVIEGQTIKDYFTSKSYRLDEINLFVRKLNLEVKYFLKTGKTVETKSNYSIGHETIKIESY